MKYYKSYHTDGIQIPLCHYVFVHADSNFAGSKMFYCTEYTRMDEVVFHAFLRALCMYTWMRSPCHRFHIYMDEHQCVCLYVPLINFWN